MESRSTCASTNRLIADALIADERTAAGHDSNMVSNFMASISVSYPPGVCPTEQRSRSGAIHVPVGALQRRMSWSAPTGTTVAAQTIVCLQYEYACELTKRQKPS